MSNHPTYPQLFEPLDLGFTLAVPTPALYTMPTFIDRKNIPTDIKLHFNRLTTYRILSCLAMKNSFQDFDVMSVKYLKSLILRQTLLQCILHFLSVYRFTQNTLTTCLNSLIRFFFICFRC